MGVLNIVKQYATPGPQPSGDVFGHFDLVVPLALAVELALPTTNGMAVVTIASGGLTYSAPLAGQKYSYERA